MSGEIRTFDQHGCARCGAELHPKITFHPFARPVEGIPQTFPDGRVSIGQFTHWALCPTNGEPILLWSGDIPAVPS